MNIDVIALSMDPRQGRERRCANQTRDSDSLYVRSSERRKVFKAKKVRLPSPPRSRGRQERPRPPAGRHNLCGGTAIIANAPTPAAISTMKVRAGEVTRFHTELSPTSGSTIAAP